jgi:Putative Se/S carrier protein-like
MSVCAITFLSVHDVLKAEKRLQAAGWRTRLVPVPKQVNPDCGLALQVPCDKLGQARDLLADMAARLKGVYEVEGAKFTALEETR